MTNEQSARLVKAFIDVRRCLQQIAGGSELTQAEFLVLRRVKKEHENKAEEFKAVRISQYLSLPPPAVSRIFNTLEGRGLIIRQINHDNRRSVIVTLTKSGEAVLEVAENKVKHLMSKLTDELGNDNCLILLSLLERVVSFLSKDEGANLG